MRVDRKLLTVALAAATLLVGLAAARTQPGPRPVATARAAVADRPTAFVLEVAGLSVPTTVGAVSAVHGDLYDAVDTTKRVGEAGGTCGLVEVVATTPTLACEAVCHVDGQGDLHLSGMLTLRATYPYTLDLVIDGGSGSYLASLGSAEATATGPGTFVVRLSILQPAPALSPSTGARLTRPSNRPAPGSW